MRCKSHITGSRNLCNSKIAFLNGMLWKQLENSIPVLNRSSTFHIDVTTNRIAPSFHKQYHKPTRTVHRTINTSSLKISRHQFHNNLPIPPFRMPHSYINPVIIPRPRSKSQIRLFLLFPHHPDIPSRNNLYQAHSSISEFAIAAPDFNEGGVECKDVFSVNDLCCARFAMPVYYF